MRFFKNSDAVGFRPPTQKLELNTKQIVPCKSTAEEVSDEWLCHRISSTGSKVRTTYLIIIWYYVKVLPKRFYWNGNTIGSHPQSHKLELHTK